MGTLIAIVCAAWLISALVTIVWLQFGHHGRAEDLWEDEPD